MSFIKKKTKTEIKTHRLYDSTSVKFKNQFKHNKLANCTGTRQSPHKTAVTSRSATSAESLSPPSLQTHRLLIPGGLVAQSCPPLATPWTVARQTTLSMGFPRQEYRSGLPFPSPGDLFDPEIETVPPVLQVASYFAAGFFID